jgi:hypothetical protein
VAASSAFKKKLVTSIERSIVTKTGTAEIKQELCSKSKASVKKTKTRKA